MTTLSDDRNPWWWRIVAVLGASGVAMGAFGAHMLENWISPHDLVIWNKAVFYHLTHAILCAFCVQSGRYFSANLLTLGVVCFSFSLYFYAVTHFFPLVFITPVGGVLLILGWIFIPLMKR